MNMEPAEKNPAELRRTAFKLVGIMVIGAVVVLTAYFAKSKQKAEANEGRPPITTKISRNFAAKNHEGKLVATYDLKGKVWFAVPVCVSQLDENKHALAMMREVANHYKGDDNVRFVAFSINGVDQGVEPEDLKRAMDQLDINDDRWWFLTTGNTKKQRGYIKDQLRLGIVSERAGEDRAGKWKFPSQMALIDREMHIRQRYDFREADQFEQAARELLEEKP
ncbi:MAG: SCO family protein, partial [Akkermansiaceae bacterium]